MALNKTEALAALHFIEDKTLDADNRSIARNYIVQLEIRNLNSDEKKECETFCNKAMTGLELQPMEDPLLFI